jgi:hypothetical protein
MSGGHGGQLDEGIVAQRYHGFQDLVAGALHRAFIMLFQQDGPDEPDDGLVVGEDADLGAGLDLAVDALGLVECNFGRCAGEEVHLGEDVALSLIHQLASFLILGRSWSATCHHWALSASASSRAKAVSMKAATTRRPCLPACASTLCIKCTRQRCHEEFRTLAMAAFSSPWASETTSLTPRTPCRVDLRKKWVQKVSASGVFLAMQQPCSILLCHFPVILIGDSLLKATEPKRRGACISLNGAGRRSVAGREKR